MNPDDTKSLNSSVPGITTPDLEVMKFTTFVDVIHVYNVSNKVNISYLTFEKKLNENVHMIPDDDRQTQTAIKRDHLTQVTL